MASSAKSLDIGIIGAGVTGLSAAFDLLNAGHKVTIYEASDITGGLAAGFKDEKWDWPLEKFYHHLFTSDKHIIYLVKELGMADKLFFPRPVTSVIFDGKIVPFDSPRRWITFPGFNLLDVARFGLVSAFLRFTNPWKRLERETADSWLRRWYGEKIYEMTWRPLLIGKFGPYYQQVNMAWMWARLKVRSPRLGYFMGGFQAFVDTLTAAVETRGGRILLNHPARKIEPQANGRLALHFEDHTAEHDMCLSTTSPDLLQRMAPDLPPEYLGQLSKLKSMGAVVLVLALKHSLMKETYWLNLPAESPDKAENEFPFLALVEQTNYIDKKHYGGDHLIYCGDYVTPDHRYFEMEKEELVALFASQLHKFNPSFSPDWIRESWLFKAKYAQPVPELNHSKNIPSIETPVPNLYFASMSQVYPWDRGTNFAVEIGRLAAEKILIEASKRQGAR
jgi:protoporphyrinogen oxidase